MPLAVDPGPLFKVELVAAARRWQTYALRAGLVLAVFVAVSLVHLNDWRQVTGRTLSINDYAQLGQQFAFAVLLTQLGVILFAAPAATAGAICLDKSRGNLTLLMASSLTSAEIVLGKLGGRMIPVFGLIATTVPVLFIATLLGGISGDLVLGGYVVIIGAAVFAAAVAFLFSVWVGRTHEALLLTYFVIFAWLLLYPMLDTMFGWRGPKMQWLLLQNPVSLMIAPLDFSSGVELTDYLLFAAATFGFAALFVLIAIWRLRKVVLSEANRGARRAKKWVRTHHNRARRLLDRAPLRWYERHRKRPTRAGRIVHALFILTALFCTAWAIGDSFGLGRMREFAIFVNMFQVGIGLLLTTVYAVTSLADERTRGGLDILLTTPVATRAIVMAKWRAAFAHVPWLVVLPLLIGLAQVQAGTIIIGKSGPDYPWMTPLLVSMLVVLPIAAGTFLISLGLYLATRVKQFGRAVGIAIAIYVVIAVAWPMVAIGSRAQDAIGIVAGSPGFGAALITAGLTVYQPELRHHVAIGACFWSCVFVLLAAIFYQMTLRIFNRCMGRISERAARPVTAKRKQRQRRGLGVEWVEPRGMP